MDICTNRSCPMNWCNSLRLMICAVCVSILSNSQLLANEIKELAKLTEHTRPISSIAFSPDGKTLATGSYDKTVRLWDLATTTVRFKLRGHTRGVHLVAFHPHGKLLASMCQDEVLKLWNAESGAESAIQIPDSVTCFAFSPDGKTIATSGDDRTVKLWDLASGKRLSMIRGHMRNARSLAFRPDGAIVATGSEDLTVKLWDVIAARPIHFSNRLAGKTQDSFQEDTKFVFSLASSPDGRTIAATDDDRSIRLWDVESSKERCTLKGHKNLVRSVAFSPDGKTIASGSFDKTVNLWNAVTGVEFASFKAHDEWINSVAFSPDGKVIATGADDNQVKLWLIKFPE